MISRYLKLGIALLIAGTIAVYVLLVVVPKRTYDNAKRIGEDFAKAFKFTPEVTVKNTIVLNQQTPVFELATINQNFQHQYTWKNTWLGSTKEISIAGTFEAKAGFDLNQKFVIRIEDETAVVTLPEPKILSVESSGDMTFRDEHGVWNWVDGQDRAKATNAYIADARRWADGAAFKEDARKEMEKRIREILNQHGKEVIFRYSSEKITPR